MTILFQEDWKKYPGAIIDYKTKNKSFIRLADIYYNLGIKNCAFHLSLLNPTLQGVDPFDVENLSEQQMFDILEECINNFWYFIREVFRVDSQGKIGGIPFKANRANIAAYWLYHNHITFLFTVIRQTGKTTTMKGIYNWLLNFGIENAYLGLVTKDMSLKGTTMTEIKEQFEYLPPYLNMARKTDTMNGDDIHVANTRNTLKAWLSNASPIGARKVARGFPIGTMGWDEVAYIENIQIAMESASFSGNNAIPTLKELGMPHGTMMFTTVGDRESRDGGYVFKMASNSTLFSDLFYDCKDNEDLQKTVFKNSSARNNADRLPMCVISYSYAQMGYSEQWMKDRLEANKHLSKTAINQDLFNIWAAASSSSPLHENDIERLKEGEVDEPIQELYAPYNFLLKWYVDKSLLEKKIDAGHSLIIGVDSSDAVGRDDIGFHIRDSATGETILAAVFNETNLFTMASFFTDFLIKYPNSVMIMERRSSAPGLIDTMITLLCAAGHNPFKRMYNTIFQDREKYPKEFEALSKARSYNEALFNKYRDHIGFTTSGNGVTSRSQLFSTTLYNMLKFTGHLIRDKLTVGQYLGLIIKNGRVDHADGGHDDMVVASLLSYWLLMNGKNLNMYGIETNLILKKNDVYLDSKFSIDNNVHKQREMVEVESEINELIEKIRGERNPIIVNQYERRIRYLYKDVKTDNNYITVEDLLEGIKRERRMKQVA